MIVKSNFVLGNMIIKANHCIQLFKKIESKDIKFLSQQTISRQVIQYFDQEVKNSFGSNGKPPKLRNPGGIQCQYRSGSLIQMGC